MLRQVHWGSGTRRSPYRRRSSSRKQINKPARTTEFPDPTPVLIDRPGYWKAGATVNNEALRPILNGSPCPGCYEANAIEGWVKFPPTERDGLPLMKHGYVELVTVPLACR